MSEPDFEAEARTWWYQAIFYEERHASEQEVSAAVDFARRMYNAGTNKGAEQAASMWKRDREKLRADLRALAERWEHKARPMRATLGARRRAFDALSTCARELRAMIDEVDE